MTTVIRVYENKHHARAVAEIVKLVKPNWETRFEQVPESTSWRAIVINSQKTSRTAENLMWEASEIFFQNTINLRTQ